MKKTNKKGFTLIELLAVIVILAIIIVMAVASVGAVLNRMRKNAYVVEANTIVKALKNEAVTDTSILPTEEDGEIYIPLSDIELQNGTKSPYGSAYDESSYVKIVKGSTTGVYAYSICIVDAKGNGIPETNIDKVTRNSVTTDIECSTEPEAGLNGNDANTLLLLHGEDLIDSSIGTKTITNDNATVSSTKYKFGTKSLYFNGNSSVYIDPSSSNFNSFNFGSGNFTIDFWMNAISFNANTTLINQWGNGGFYSWIIICPNGAITMYYNSIESGFSTGLQSSTVLSTNTWYHIAIVRNANSLKLYINGTLDKSGTMTGTLSFPNEELRIGRNGDTGYYPSNSFTGYMDEIRISNIARWIDDFSQELPTKEYS